MVRRIAALLLLSVTLSLPAQPAPKAPDVYTAQLRYRINASGNERLRQYDEMLKALRAAGFTRDPEETVADDEPDNPSYVRMSGTIATKDVEKLLRQRHVRSLLLVPKGTKLPEKDARVRIDVRLADDLTPSAQRQFSVHVNDVLAKDAGFVPAVGFDHKGHTRLVGSVPVDQLNKLIEDIRDLPSAKGAPSLARSGSPIRLTIVRPDWPVPSSRPKPAEVPESQAKFTPELQRLLAGGDAGKRTRLEAVLGWTPEESDRSWHRGLERAGCVVEGRLGPVVTVVGVPKAVAPRLAEMPGVAHVRIPPSGKLATLGSDKEPTFEPLRANGKTTIHAMERGKGTRVVVVGDDFRGWEKLKGGKSGRPDVTLLDLTAERSPDLQPDPVAGGAGEGYGTRCARALLALAPEAEVTLVRIDPQAAFMTKEVANAIHSGDARTITLEARLKEIREEGKEIDRLHDELTEERSRLLGRPTSEETAKALEAHRVRQSAFDRDKAAYLGRLHRFVRLDDGLRKLKGARLVISTLAWPEGYPVDGARPMTQWFDDRPYSAALWFQAVGDKSGEVLTGHLRDVDHNGIFEIVGDKTESPEVNFLRWQPAKGAVTDTLPAGARVRLTLQWREAHEALPLRVGDDVYREPLNKLGLVVVNQVDPEGKARPADDFDVVASSVGRPVRIDQRVNAGTYEQSVEFTVKKPGRYAVFVEGQLASGTQAAGEVELPSLRKTSEVHPRVVVQTLAGDGRVVWK